MFVVTFIPSKASQAIHLPIKLQAFCIKVEFKSLIALFLLSNGGHDVPTTPRI